jgi:uncharacterized protein (TIGR03437 family)
VVSAASSKSGTAPGSIASIYGTNLASGTCKADRIPLPTQLQCSNTKVLFNGREAPLYYVSPDQINAQVPFESGPGMISVNIIRDGLQSGAEVINVQNQAPASFTINQQGTGYVAMQHANYNAVTPANPMRPAETGIFYGTGFGQSTPPVATGQGTPTDQLYRTAVPTVRIGGQTADVLFSGKAPFFVGLDQINATLPATLPTGSQTVEICFGSTCSPAAEVPVVRGGANYVAGRLSNQYKQPAAGASITVNGNPATASQDGNYISEVPSVPAQFKLNDSTYYFYNDMLRSTGMQPDILAIKRFVEPGTGPNRDLWEWYTFETGSGTEVNWTYPIAVFLNKDDPLAKSSGRDYATALKTGIGSWESKCGIASGKVWNFSDTAMPSGFTNSAIEVKYISDPTKPCAQPIFPPVVNNTITYRIFNVNTLCVTNWSFVNQGAHEIGRGLGFTAEDPTVTHIMNPGNAVNNPNATQSPVECEAMKLRLVLPPGYDKSKISK